MLVFDVELLVLAGDAAVGRQLVVAEGVDQGDS